MTGPYYSDELVTIWHGKAEDVARWVHGDVLLTDPPYGIAWHSHARAREGAARSIAGDEDTAVRDGILDAWGPTRPALVFGSWKRPHPEGTHTLLIWDTKGALGAGNLAVPWKPAHQQVYVLGGPFHGYRGTDVLRCPPVQSKGRYHPHQKPVALLDALLSKCPDGTVVDPCAGSGSTGVAAKALGRPCVLVEEEEAHCQSAAERIARVDVADHLFDLTEVTL